MDDDQEQPAPTAPPSAPPAPPAPAAPPAEAPAEASIPEPPADVPPLPEEPGDRLAAGMLVGIAACLLLCAALVLIAAGRG